MSKSYSLIPTAATNTEIKISSKMTATCWKAAPEPVPEICILSINEQTLVTNFWARGQQPVACMWPSQRFYAACHMIWDLANARTFFHEVKYVLF